SLLADIAAAIQLRSLRRVRNYNHLLRHWTRHPTPVLKVLVKLRCNAIVFAISLIRSCRGLSRYAVRFSEHPKQKSPRDFASIWRAKEASATISGESSTTATSFLAPSRG